MTHEVTINAGLHERRDCPVRFSLPEAATHGEWELMPEDGDSLPLQRVGREAACLLPFMEAGSSRTYRLQPAAHSTPGNTVSLRQEQGGLSVRLRDELL